MSDKAKNLVRVSAAEEDDVARSLLLWLNTWDGKPVDAVEYEYLDADKPCMALSLIQGAYKTRQYILGGYEAQLQFKLIYRAQPIDSAARLDMDKLLNAFADWATSAGTLQLGDRKRVARITSNTRAALFARYENSDEDHQTLLTLTYEVI